MKHRIAKTQQLIAKNKIDAMLITHSSDLFYLTGKRLSSGRLLITKKENFLFVDGRYFEGCQDIEGVKAILTPHFGEASTFNQKWRSLKLKKVGIDGCMTSHSSYLEYEKMGSSLVVFEHPIREIRMIKDDKEIALLKKAAKLNSEGFDFVSKRLRVGAIEEELVRELEIFWLEKGGEGIAFSPIIAFGKGTAIPHYYPSRHKLKKGDAVLIDIGVKWENYLSDMTRTLFFGTPHPKLVKIYQVVAAAQRKAFSLLKPGVLISTVEDAARKIIEKAGFGDYFPHGLGHGVGLEIHEAPFLRKTGSHRELKLQAGMVITIEPGIYLPSIGGVRLEDTVLITEKGYENLTKRPLLAFNARDDK